MLIESAASTMSGSTIVSAVVEREVQGYSCKMWYHESMDAGRNNPVAYVWFDRKHLVYINAATKVATDEVQNDEDNLMDIPSTNSSVDLESNLFDVTSNMVDETEGSSFEIKCSSILSAVKCEVLDIAYNIEEVLDNNIAYNIDDSSSGSKSIDQDTHETNYSLESADNSQFGVHSSSGATLAESVKQNDTSTVWYHETMTSNGKKPSAYTWFGRKHVVYPNTDLKYDKTHNICNKEVVDTSYEILLATSAAGIRRNAIDNHSDIEDERSSFQSCTTEAADAENKPKYYTNNIWYHETMYPRKPFVYIWFDAKHLVYLYDQPNIDIRHSTNIARQNKIPAVVFSDLGTVNLSNEVKDESNMTSKSTQTKYTIISSTSSDVSNGITVKHTESSIESKYTSILGTDTECVINDISNKPHQTTGVSKPAIIYSILGDHLQSVVVEDTSNLAKETNAIKYPIASPEILVDTNHLAKEMYDSDLEIKYPIRDKDLQREGIEGTNHLTEETDDSDFEIKHSIADEDPPSGVVEDTISMSEEIEDSSFEIIYYVIATDNDCEVVVEGTRNLSQGTDDSNFEIKNDIVDNDLQTEGKEDTKTDNSGIEGTYSNADENLQSGVVEDAISTSEEIDDSNFEIIYSVMVADNDHQSEIVVEGSRYMSQGHKDSNFEITYNIVDIDLQAKGTEGTNSFSEVSDDPDFGIKCSIADNDLQSEGIESTSNLAEETDDCISDEEVIVDRTSKLIVDTVEVLQVTSNLSQLPDDTDLRMKYPITDEDLPSEVLDITHHMEHVTHDSKLKIKYSIDDEVLSIDIPEESSNMGEVTDDSKLKIKYSIADLQDQLLEDTSNLEVVTDYSIDDEDLHHEVIVGSTSNLTVDTDEVLGVTSNLKVLPDDSNLKIRYSTTTEDQTIDILEDNSNMEEITDDSKLKIKYSIVDEDLRREVQEDTSNLEVVTDYSIDDEDLHHGVVVDPVPVI